MRYLMPNYTKRINNFDFATTESCSIILPLSIYNNLLSEHCNKVVSKSSSKCVDCKLFVSQSCHELQHPLWKTVENTRSFSSKNDREKATFGIKTFVQTWTFRICTCSGQQYILLRNIVRNRLGMITPRKDAERRGKMLMYSI